MTQFVSVKFRPTDKRSYTYSNEGDPVSVGDFVKVPDSREDGWKRVEVVAVTDAAPSFPTKPILGLAPEQPPEDDLLNHV